MLCAICRSRTAQLTCRRCHKRICANCHAGHGLCISCRQHLARA